MSRARKGKQVNGRWTDSKKIEAVTTYLAVGTLPLTAAILGVPLETLKWWKVADWWKDIERELRDSENIELSARLKKIVDKSIDAVVDRLDNGEHMFNPRTGEIIRVPVKTREALRAVESMIDKRQILLEKPTRITEQRTVDDRLNKLAEEFKAFSQARTIEGTVLSSGDTLEGPRIDSNEFIVPKGT